MTSSGKNDLNIRTNASPKWDRTRCPKFVIRSKSVIKSSSVISSQIGGMCKIEKVPRDMSDQLRVSLYMVMSKNVM